MALAIATRIMARETSSSGFADSEPSPCATFTGALAAVGAALTDFAAATLVGFAAVAGGAGLGRAAA
jgi:hypothetical protein